MTIPVRSNCVTRRWLSRIFRVIGVALLAFSAIARLYGLLYNYAAVEAFSLNSDEKAQSEQADFTLWDSKRVQAYKAALLKKIDPPLAVLRIDRIGLVVSIFEGTGDLILDRGAGHISGTAHIGGSGNIGIAGHRDGFFRGLKDIAKNDEIQIQTADKTYIYTIDRILIVKPEEIWVLAPDQKPSVTLVTCHPFYFIGHAPNRYIVKASLKEIKSREN